MTLPGASWVEVSRGDEPSASDSRRGPVPTAGAQDARVLEAELVHGRTHAGVVRMGFASPEAAKAARSFVDTIAALLSSAIDREHQHEALVRAQKRDAAARLAANVTHDVNNLLAAIAADAWTLGHTTSGAAKELAEHILVATRKGALLTGRLRALSGRAAVQPELVEVDQIAKRHAEGLTRRHPQHRIEVVSAAEKLPVLIDRGDVDQILEALTSNAIHAMPNGGTLRLEVSRQADVEPARVRLVVADTGPGIDDATRERLFEPFFSTRPEAAGLGLALTREILDRLGGSIDIASRPGAGTRATVELPLALEAAQSDPVATRPSGGREVLLVDDDALVRRSILRLLTKEGYVVTQAADGVEALEALARKPEIGLVVSDVVMPRLDGIELARRVRAERGLPVILLSGFVDARELDPDVPLLSKPFAPAELLETVSRAIGLATAIDEPPPPSPREDAHALVVAVMLHDINNALAVIGPGAEMLREIGPDDERIPAIAEDVHTATLACVAMVRQALRLSSTRTRKESIVLSELVRSLERPLRKIIGSRGRLTLDVADSVRPFTGDRGTLERALVNLVINARDALVDNGEIELAVHDEGQREVVLEVQDNGRGIPAEVLPRIFEPFFSTKGADGSGLGLTVVKAAVDELGGHIDVTSTPGQATTFRLHFPVA